MACEAVGGLFYPWLLPATWKGKFSTCKPSDGQIPLVLQMVTVFELSSNQNHLTWSNMGPLCFPPGTCETTEKPHPRIRVSPHRSPDRVRWWRSAGVLRLGRNDGCGAFGLSRRVAEVVGRCMLGSEGRQRVSAVRVNRASFGAEFNTHHREMAHSTVYLKGSIFFTGFEIPDIPASMVSERERRSS